jgi:lipid-binding SYLF domain-containing protein
MRRLALSFFAVRSGSMAALSIAALSFLTFTTLSNPASAADGPHDKRFADAIEVLTAFTQDETTGIPIDLLARAHGIAVIPNVIRGGFLVGGRRGRGVLTVRGSDGRFSNPVLITLTGGSIGGQIGVAAADVVLVFANERSVRNIASGKFTLGGDATAVAGPSGRHNTVAVTGNAEIYMYVRSRGLYAGAALEGARLDVDEEATALFYYAANSSARAFGPPSDATPAPARAFLTTLDRVGGSARPPGRRQAPGSAPADETEEGTRTFPLER